MANLTNKFTGLIEVSNPPIKTFVLKPNKDALLMKDEPRANYGKSSMMMVNPSVSRGSSASIYNFTGIETVPEKVWNGLIGIDFRVNYSGSAGLKADVNASLYKYDYPNDWEEEYVYWESAPLKGEHITDTTITKSTTLSNFDVKDLVLSKKADNQTDIGFYLESNDVPSKRVVSIYSREDVSRTPLLVFKYYDIPGTLLIRTFPGVADIMGLVGKSVYYDKNNKPVPFDSPDIARVDYSENMEIRSGELTVDSFLKTAWINGIDPVTGEGTLYIPKYTPFKIDINNADSSVLTIDEGGEYRENKSVFDIVEDIDSYESDDITTTESTGDLINGETTIAVSGPFAVINGETRVWKGSAFNITFKNKDNEVLYSGADVDDIDKWYPDNRVATTESDGDLIVCNKTTWDVKGDITDSKLIFDANLYVIKNYKEIHNYNEINGVVSIAVEYETENKDDEPIITGEVSAALLRFKVTEYHNLENPDEIIKTESDGDLITCPIGVDDNGDPFLKVDGRVGITTYYDENGKELGTKHLDDTEFDHSDHDIQISGELRIPKYNAIRIEFFNLSDTSFFVNEIGMDSVDMLTDMTEVKKSVGDPVKEISCDIIDGVNPFDHLDEPDQVGLWVFGNIDGNDVEISGTVDIAQPTELENDGYLIECEQSDVLPDDYDLANMYVLGAVGWFMDPNPAIGLIFDEDQEIILDKYPFTIDDDGTEHYRANTYDEVEEAVDSGNDILYVLSLVSKTTWYDKLGNPHQTEIPDEDTKFVDWSVQLTGVVDIANNTGLDTDDLVINCDKSDITTTNIIEAEKANMYVIRKMDELDIPEIECTKVDGKNPIFDTAEDLHLYIAASYEVNNTNTDNIIEGSTIVSYASVFSVTFTDAEGSNTYDESHTLATAYDKINDMISTTSNGDLITCDVYKWPDGSTTVEKFSDLNTFKDGLYIVGTISNKTNDSVITGTVDIAVEYPENVEITGSIDGIIYPVFTPESDGDLIECADMKCTDPIHENDLSKVGLYVLAELPDTPDTNIICDQSPNGTELENMNCGIIGIVGKTTWYNTAEEVVPAPIDEDYEAEYISHTDYEPTEMQIEGHVDAAYLKQAWLDCDLGKLFIGNAVDIPDGIDCPDDGESLVIVANIAGSYGFIL